MLVLWLQSKSSTKLLFIGDTDTDTKHSLNHSFSALSMYAEFSDKLKHLLPPLLLPHMQLLFYLCIYICEAKVYCCCSLIRNNPSFLRFRAHLWGIHEAQNLAKMNDQAVAELRSQSDVEGENSKFLLYLSRLFMGTRRLFKCGKNVKNAKPLALPRNSQLGNETLRPR